MLNYIISCFTLGSLLFAQSYVPAQHTYTNVNPCLISPAIIRGSNSGVNPGGTCPTCNALTLALPFGSAVGDLDVGFQANGVCQSYPAGWANIYSNGPCPRTWAVSAFSKVLDSSDVAAGSIVIPSHSLFGPGFSFQVGAIVGFVGAMGGIRELDANTGAGPVGLTANVTTSSAVTSTDIGIYWATSDIDNRSGPLPLAITVTPPGCPVAPLQTILTNVSDTTSSILADSRLGNGIQVISNVFNSGAGVGGTAIVVVVEN